MSDLIKASLVGVPLDLGAHNLGVDVGPQAFRYRNIVEKLKQSGIEVTDLGNVEPADREKLTPGNPRLHFLDEIVRVNNELAARVNSEIAAGHKAIVLGGDHSVNLGAVSGASAALNGQLGLIYFDAHGDMNTDETTLTGNIHGMHLASLMGFGADELKSVHSPEVKIAKENLLHIGGSDFDAAEVELIKREGLQAFTLFDLLKNGLAPLLEMIDKLAAQIPNIWVSLDLDAIDKIYAPGAGMPNAKGLQYREIATIAEYIGQHCKVVGIDVVEYNPLQDEDYKTAELGIELIAKFFGSDFSWYTSTYLTQNKID